MNYSLLWIMAADVLILAGDPARVYSPFQTEDCPIKTEEVVMIAERLQIRNG